MTRYSDDHVVTRANQNGTCTFVCLHCHDSYTPAMPIPVYLFSALAKAFVSNHKKCPAPVLAVGMGQKEE